MRTTHLQKIQREIIRVAILIIVGLLIIHFSPQYAMAWGIPALSPFGLFLGGMFLAAAVSHVMRRVLFPQLDLQLIARQAIYGINDNGPNMPAALIFVGICAVLITLLMQTAQMLRM